MRQVDKTSYLIQYIKANSMYFIFSSEDDYQEPYDIGFFSAAAAAEYIISHLS